MLEIRTIREGDFGAALAIINDAARAYRGIIPADRWHEPYMSPDELESEIADGVFFWVAEEEGRLLGLMGMQDKREVALVRHAYIAPTTQRSGLGTKLLRHVTNLSNKPILIGTWAAATWAIEFYRRNGFALVPDETKDSLLRKYWSIPERQIETSVVLADGRWLESQRPGPTRRECLAKDLESREFVVLENPQADGAEPIFEISAFSGVAKHSALIDRVAREADIDPRLIRAIMHMETTHGYYDAPLALIGENKSILPMNVNVEYWGSTFGDREALNDPYENIKAGAEILKRIVSRLPPDASVRQIATLYNNIDAQSVSDYGARVDRIYEEQPWLDGAGK
jgi:N-acetylglutamate synthase-like GNAT family acetyltransferase